MADSSPGIQSPTSNFLAELGPPSPEAQPSINLAGSQKEASARLASELLADQGDHTSNSTSNSSGLTRAAGVLAGGIKDGLVNSAENCLNLQTAKTVVESAAFGYGMGALAKAGPIGQKIAMAGGLIMGASWVYSEYERGRPQATVRAVADAYNSSAHIAQDRQSVATNGGALLFETGLAFAAGGLGMKKGLELNTNWQVDAIAGVKSSYSSVADFLAKDGHVNGAHVLQEGDLGTAFAGRDANAPASVMSQAKDIITGKSKGTGSFNDIQETFNRSQAQRNDTHLLDVRSQLVDLEGQHSQIRAEENGLAPKLAKAAKDKVELESLTPLEQTVRVRQQTLADAQQAQRDIPGKKRELDKLFTEKQAAFELQKPKDGAAVDPKLRQDFQTKHQNFLEVKAKYDELKANGSTESIQRHRESLDEANAALQQARQEQPAKLAAAQTEIDTLNQQLTALKTQRLAIEDQVKPLIETYNARLKAVTADPTKLVQAQFEPPPQPVQKVAPAKAPVAATLDLTKVDMQPVVTEPISPIGLRGDNTAGATAIHTAAEPISPIGFRAVTEPISPIGFRGDNTDAGFATHPETAAKPASAPETVIAPGGVKGAAAEVTDPVFEAKPQVVDAKATRTGGAPTDQTASGDHGDVKARKAGDPGREGKIDSAESAGVGLLSQEAKVSREAALKAVKSNELVREQEYTSRVLGDIDRGTYKPARGASVAEVKIDMERRLAEVNEKLKGDPGIKYTRALKSVLQYSRSVGRQLAATTDSGMRDGITEQALTDIEGMMGRLPTSYKGYQGKMPDLAEPTRAGRIGSAEKRFADVSDHLESKVANLDNSRAKQVADMADRQPTLSEIMKRLNSSSLPDDGSIILIGNDGKYLGPKGGTSPYFIEVARMKGHGVGADGGGFNRFEGIQNDIAGAVVLRPIYDTQGKPVELPGRNSGGKPVYKKIVAETFGTVPEGITANLNFVDILRRFAPAR